MAAPDDPNVVRAVIERQIEYLGEQVSRIDGDHGEIIRRLDELKTTLRALLDDPPQLQRHWEFGQAVFLAKWSDAAARAVGNRVLTFVFAAILAGVLTWAVLTGRSGK